MSSAEITQANDTRNYTPWFKELIHKLRIDELKLSTGTARKEEQELYNAFMDGESNTIHSMARQQSTMYFTDLILKKYVSEVLSREIQCNKLALSMSDERILVWAEIKDDDEESEKQLILAQASVNAKFHEYGLHIESMIVEKSDMLDVPSQYVLIQEG